MWSGMGGTKHTLGKKTHSVVEDKYYSEQFKLLKTVGKMTAFTVVQAAHFGPGKFQTDV